MYCVNSASSSPQGPEATLQNSMGDPVCNMLFGSVPVGVSSQGSLSPLSVLSLNLAEDQGEIRASFFLLTGRSLTQNTLMYRVPAK